MSFCDCHDDYVDSGTFDLANVRVYRAFQVFYEGGQQPMPGQTTETPIIDRFKAFYADGVSSGVYPEIGATLVTLPADPKQGLQCANYDEDDANTLSISDYRVYRAFQVFHEGGRQPMTGQNLDTPIMDRFLAFYADGVSSGVYPEIGATVKHLPVLQTDTKVITLAGIINRCIQLEDKLWISFTGNDHFSDWFEMSTDELDGYTKFKIISEDYNKDLQIWMNPRTTNLQGIMMTASPTKPSASSLTETQQQKTYNSEFVSFDCDGVFNNNHGTNENQVNLRVQAYNNQNAPSLKKYGSEGSEHGYLAEGKPWAGSNMVYRTTTFSSIVRDDSGKNSVDIDYMYFIKETDEEAKIKFSEFSNSSCNVFPQE